MRAHHVGGVRQLFCPADMVHWVGVGLLMFHCLQRLSDNDLTLVRCLVFAA